MRARLRSGRRRALEPRSTRLHLGCGDRYIPGWLNVDLVKSDWDLDLTSGRLPWASATFDAIVAQQLVEHLDLEDELLPLLRELRRILRPGGQLWLSTPDMAKACRSYLEHGMRDLLEDHHRWYPMDRFAEMPPQQFLNHLFHQGGEHRNLFDFELLAWALGTSGFDAVHRASEPALLATFPEFPVRNDDFHSLYVQACVSPVAVPVAAPEGNAAAKATV